MSGQNNIPDGDAWPTRAWYADGRICVELEDGRRLDFPVQGNPRLESAPEEQVGNIQILAGGLHWPELDEDLSIEGILAGDYGQRIHAIA
jgi:hypothetical protein